MIGILVQGASWLSLGIGAAFILIGALGIIRLPDFWSRIHAAGIIDTAGVGFITLGLMLQAGFTLITLKLLLIAVFIFITGPTATHAIANAAFAARLRPFALAGDESGTFDSGKKKS
ncbi:sodium:proton antiporter [Parvibaculum sedimenti]|uniref:Sodium:proton antiporter n=1 Tax=Parvibaculum sedimenti TaxID=2608632 RepID=A0A6N6VKY1_9HYPH|nr:monovalent cation/H(+) antiporter subunit G [Parvibaculum sedimenti]KAB7740068.1 sodium:proton antiporter [Parvibaculum sedimenti]